MASLPETAPRACEPTTLEWTGLSFVYWVVFMGALAPGNVSRVLVDGGAPNWGLLIIHLIVAGALGASVTPLLLELRRRAPLSGRTARRNLLVQLVAAMALAALLIVVSCFLVAWFIDQRLLPSQGALARQIFADLALLVLCITLLLAAMQAASLLLRQATGPIHPNHLAIGDRGGTIIVTVSDIDWIEAQGNYQALHTKSGIHLYRATSAEMEARLDPAQFVRIHRSCLVALKEIERLEPLSSGDGLVILRDGAKLRQARRYRAALRKHLQRS